MVKQGAVHLTGTVCTSCMAWGIAACAKVLV
jgi:hypothetical protein